jgi:hypothetical protein
MIELWWTDDDGHRWQISDVVAETRKDKRVPVPVQVGNGYARWRVFTCDDGSRRVYQFGQEHHGVTEPTLRRQFLASEPR